MSSNVDDRLNWLAMQYVLGELSDTDRDQFEGRLADDLAVCEAVAEASRTRLVLHAAIASSVAANSDFAAAQFERNPVGIGMSNPLQLVTRSDDGDVAIIAPRDEPIASQTPVFHQHSSLNGSARFCSVSSGASASPERPGHPTGRVAPVRIQRSRQAVAAVVAAIACLFLVMVVGGRDGADSSQSRVARHSGRAAMELVLRWRTEMKFADVEADDLDDELHDSSTDIAVPGWLLAGVSLEKQGVIDGQPDDLQDN